MKRKGTHVTTNLSGGWSVKKSGATRSSKNFSNQQDAIKYARTTAKKEAGELYIHGVNGRILERNSYGKDPFPPRG